MAATWRIVAATTVLLPLSFGSPAVAQPKSSAEPSALIGLVQIASQFGYVTSTVRSVAHNKAVGGKSNSFHLQGRAIDVARFSKVSHATLTAALQRSGYALIEAIDEGDHSHFAFDEPRSRPKPASVKTPSSIAPAQADPDGDGTYPKLAADSHGKLIVDLTR
jgi:hypothetical protein